MTIARLASLALVLLAAPGARAAPAPSRPVAFLGLRPAEDARLSETALAHLPDAQRLRAVAENVVEMLSGSPVLRHDDLRAALGRAYLVELFECRADAACQLRVAAPLRRHGVAVAVVGEYDAAGDPFRIRVRRLDLVKGRVADEVESASRRAAAAALGTWRAALGPAFQDTGSVRIATNVPGAACALDGAPCTPDPDGVLADVPEGEHVLELSKEGYRRAHRVVAVRRREELRVAIALEELPVQAQKAPDPNARVPTFEAPGERTQVVPYGFLRVALGWDSVNAGDREDPLALPRVGGVEDGGVVVLARPALAGVTVQAPRSDGGWEVRGALAAAWVKDAGPEIDAAFAEVVNEERGLRAMLGLGQPIVSSLTAGTLTLPEGFGDLAAGLVGATLSQSVGPFVLEAFVGRHKSQFSTEADAGGASPGPFGAARIALVSERHVGTLYGEEYPLTLAVSAVRGAVRVGLAEEQAWAAAEGIAAPVREDLDVRVASVEAFVPFGRRASLSGEAYVGEEARLLEGALWQAPRVDPVTGRHAALRSAGGWAQLSIAAGPALELRVVAGIDRVLRGLDAGLAPDGGAAIRENRLGAVNAVWYALDQLALGVQVHAVRTEYADAAHGSPTLVGAVATGQLKF